MDGSGFPMVLVPFGLAVAVAVAAGAAVVCRKREKRGGEATTEGDDVNESLLGGKRVGVETLDTASGGAQPAKTGLE